jgi:hypothetical protein
VILAGEAELEIVAIPFVALAVRHNQGHADRDFLDQNQGMVEIDPSVTDLKDLQVDIIHRHLHNQDRADRDFPDQNLAMVEIDPSVIDLKDLLIDIIHRHLHNQGPADRDFPDRNQEALLPPDAEFTKIAL